MHVSPILRAICVVSSVWHFARLWSTAGIRVMRVSCACLSCCVPFVSLRCGIRVAQSPTPNNKKPHSLSTKFMKFKPKACLFNRFWKKTIGFRTNPFMQRHKSLYDQNEFSNLDIEFSNKTVKTLPKTHFHFTKVVKLYQKRISTSQKLWKLDGNAFSVWKFKNTAIQTHFQFL